MSTLPLLATLHSTGLLNKILVNIFYVIDVIKMGILPTDALINPYVLNVE